MTTRLLPAFVVLLLLVAAGCGGGERTAAIPSGDETTPASSDTAETESTTPETTSKPARPTRVTRALAKAVSGDGKKRPKIEKPAGDPPDGLVIHDIAGGSGPAAESGDAVEVDYVGVAWSTGAEFDASWKGGETFPFTLGNGDVIPGWDEGVAGMKEGSRRMLVIPPDLAYGEQGSPPSIGPNETLVFVIDMRKVG